MPWFAILHHFKMPLAMINHYYHHFRSFAMLNHSEAFLICYDHNSLPESTSSIIINQSSTNHDYQPWNIHSSLDIHQSSMTPWPTHDPMIHRVQAWDPTKHGSAAAAASELVTTWRWKELGPKAGATAGAHGYQWRWSMATNQPWSIHTDHDQL